MLNHPFLTFCLCCDTKYFVCILTALSWRAARHGKLFPPVGLDRASRIWGGGVGLGTSGRTCDNTLRQRL